MEACQGIKQPVKERAQRTCIIRPEKDIRPYNLVPRIRPRGVQIRYVIRIEERQGATKREMQEIKTNQDCDPHRKKTLHHRCNPNRPKHRLKSVPPVVRNLSAWCHSLQPVS